MRPSLGVSASNHAALYLILSPTGPYIRSAKGSGGSGIALLAMGDQVRALPGGAGGHKLGLNYAPGFVAQRSAAAFGHQQLLWVLGETGAVNAFAVFKRPDGGKFGRSLTNATYKAHWIPAFPVSCCPTHTLALHPCAGRHLRALLARHLHGLLHHFDAKCSAATLQCGTVYDLADATAEVE